MVDNSSEFYLENDLLYNVSSIALVPCRNAEKQATQTSILNSGVILSPEQLDLLTVQPENNSTMNGVSILEVNNRNLLISSNTSALTKLPKIQNTNTRSVLKKNCINDTLIDPNVVDLVSINIPQYSAPVPKTIVQKETKIGSVLKKESVVQEVPNKIVYRILHPQELRLTDKKQTTAIERSEPLIQTEKKVGKSKVNPVKLKDASIKEPTVNNEKKAMKDIADGTEVENIVKPVRTRFGRITKPPQHLKRDKKSSININEKNSEEFEPPRKQMRTVDTSDIISNNNSLKVPSDIQPQNFEQLQLSKNQAINNQSLSNGTKKFDSDLYVSELKNPKRKVVSTKFLCKTCHKFYLGKARMKRHLELNPDHIVKNKYEPNNQLWSDLLERTMNASKPDQVKTFLGELSNVLQKVRTIVPKALKPVLAEMEANSCQIDNFLSSVLGVPEGKYTLNLNVLDEDNFITTFNVTNTNEKNCTDVSNEVDITNTQNDERISSESDNAVQTSLLNLLDTGQVNFDATDSAHTSEEVMCVDQLVQERLKTLTDVELDTLPPTANSSQNLTLDLSMDLFSYTS